MITICNFPCWLPQKVLALPSPHHAFCTPDLCCCIIPCTSCIWPTSHAFSLNHNSSLMHPSHTLSNPCQISHIAPWTTHDLTDLPCTPTNTLPLPAPGTYDLLPASPPMLFVGSQQEVDPPNDHGISFMMATETAGSTIAKQRGHSLWLHHLAAEFHNCHHKSRITYTY